MAVYSIPAFRPIKALQPMSRYMSLDVSFARRFYIYAITFRYIFIIIICTVDLFIQPLDSFFRLICFFFSLFRTKESNIKTSSNKGEEWKARNYRQCITNETRCWIYTIVANTYSLLPTSPRRDIAALPSNRMRWCILDCVYRIPATERKESLQRSLYTFPFIIIIITLLQI